MHLNTKKLSVILSNEPGSALTPSEMESLYEFKFEKYLEQYKLKENFFQLKSGPLDHILFKKVFNFIERITELEKELTSVLENTPHTKRILNLLNFSRDSDGISPHLFIKSYLSTFPRINNIGDPWQRGNNRMDTKKFQSEIMDIFASKFGFKKTQKNYKFEKFKEPKDYWGYISNRKGATSFWAKLQGERNLIKSQYYLLTKKDLKTNCLKEKLFQMKKDNENNIGVNICIDESNNLIDFNKIISELKQLNLKSFYIHWETNFTYPEFQNILTIPIEVSSVSIDVQKLYELDNSGELLLYRKDKGEIQGTSVEYICQKDKVIEGSLNGQTALELWFLIKIGICDPDLPTNSNDGAKRELIIPENTINYLNQIYSFPNSEETVAKLERIRRDLILALLPRSQQENYKQIAPILKDVRYKMSKLCKKVLGYPMGNDTTTLLKSIRSSLVLFPPLNLTNESSEECPLRIIEKKVVQFFAQRHSLSSNQVWGYVSTGGTESNNWGILQGRHRFPDSKVFFTEDTHYSVPKIVELYKIPFKIVKSLEDGATDLEDLVLNIKNQDPYTPPIIVVTVGTTMKGAIDNIDNLTQLLKKNNIYDYYIHCDSALMSEIIPEFSDFSRFPLDSVAMSTHKWLGTSRIGSIVMCNTLRNPSRVGPVTLRRDGKLILEMALKIEAGGEPMLKKYKYKVRSLVKYLKKRIAEEKLDHNILLNCQNSNTLLIKKPESKQFRKDWGVAEGGECIHFVVMPWWEKEQIDLFIADYKQYEKL